MKQLQLVAVRVSVSFTPITVVKIVVIILWCKCI